MTESQHLELTRQWQAFPACLQAAAASFAAYPHVDGNDAYLIGYACALHDAKLITRDAWAYARALPNGAKSSPHFCTAILAHASKTSLAKI